MEKKIVENQQTIKIDDSYYDQANKLISDVRNSLRKIVQGNII